MPLRIQVRSPLPPDECLRRIAALVAPAPYPTRSGRLRPPPRKPFAGSVGGQTFLIQRQRAVWSNLWKPTLYGSVAADGGGALVRGTFGLAPGALVGMAILLALGLVSTVPAGDLSFVTLGVPFLLLASAVFFAADWRDAGEIARTLEAELAA